MYQKIDSKISKCTQLLEILETYINMNNSNSSIYLVVVST